MTTIRVQKNKNYFAASNEPFNDKRLSWESRGLMGYLLSKPDGWKVRLSDLENQGPAGEYKLKRMIAELKLYGYVNRIRVRHSDGTFEWNTDVFESPSLNPSPTSGRFSTGGLPTSGKPHDIDNTEQVNTESEEEGEVFKVYEQNIEPITPVAADTLNDYITEHGSHWTIEAIKEAARLGKRNAKYIGGILKRWRSDGYGTDHPAVKAKRMALDSQNRDGSKTVGQRWLEKRGK